MASLCLIDDCEEGSGVSGKFVSLVKLWRVLGLGAQPAFESLESQRLPTEAWGVPGSLLACLLAPTSSSAWPSPSDPLKSLCLGHVGAAAGCEGQGWG